MGVTIATNCQIRCDGGRPFCLNLDLPQLHKKQEIKDSIMRAKGIGGGAKTDYLSQTCIPKSFFPPQLSIDLGNVIVWKKNINGENAQVGKPQLW